MAATAATETVIERTDDDTSGPTAPLSPRSLEETGLSEGFLGELILKTLHVYGDMLGAEVGRKIRLPFNILIGPLQHLKDRLLVEITGGDVVGPVSYCYTLSERGVERARELYRGCAYVGPAPVPLQEYNARARQQGVKGTACTPEQLLAAFQDMVISPDLLDDLGPALCAGRSIFIYGPPGNGKTCIAKALGSYLDGHSGDIYVPYAILAEAGIITVFDPTIHETIDAEHERIGLDHPEVIARLLTDDAQHLDGRWRRIRRPVVVTGGELTLDMLELQYNPTANYYQAPLHIKANGGVFLIDDFGRQLVSPKDLLNRWILPLEEQVDYLTLQTGRKFSVPFEQLIIFSTNLEPQALVDDAFLRRMRHKIKIDSPDRELLEQIFQLVCEAKQLEYDPWVVDYLFREQYHNGGRPPRNSDPRDLLDTLAAVCAYQDWPFELTRRYFKETCGRFFGEL